MQACAPLGPFLDHCASALRSKGSRGQGSQHCASVPQRGSEREGERGGERGRKRERERERELIGGCCVLHLWSCVWQEKQGPVHLALYICAQKEQQGLCTDRQLCTQHCACELQGERNCWVGWEVNPPAMATTTPRQQQRPTKGQVATSI